MLRGSSDQALALFLSLYVGWGFFVALGSRLDEFLWLKICAPLKQSLACRLMDKLLAHSVNTFHTHLAGSLSNKIRDVMEDVASCFNIILHRFFSHTLSLIIGLLTISTAGRQFALLLCGWGLLFIAPSLWLSRKGQKLSDQAAQFRSQASGQIVDVLSNVLNVFLFSGKRRELSNLHQSLGQYVKADQKLKWFYLGFNAFERFLFIAYQAFAVLFLWKGHQRGTVTAGDFVLLLTLNVKFFEILSNLTADIEQFAEFKGRIIQGLRLMLQPPAIQDLKGAPSLILTRGEITFKAVKFSYHADHPLFENLSVHIPAGQKVGLVGYSGGGKSTFFHLLLRLYEVSGGAIFIDGQDIREVRQDSLRHQISMIPQDPTLFHRTLFQNILYGREEASEEEVFQAAKLAHAHDFILQLPQGYDSLVGERGVKLSGGQRQRIAIARALLKQAPLLLLDEATSQLDSLTERHIQESLTQLMKGKTTLVIAHRLSTLLKMERILVFDKGRLIQDGSHQELLSQEGLYRTLWDAQVEGFLPCHPGAKA